jgi:Tfp pilus assembly protein PilF
MQLLAPLKRRRIGYSSQPANARRSEIYRSQINLEPESAWHKGNYASYLAFRERYDEAISWARGAIAQMNYRAAHMTLGRAYAGKAGLALEAGKRDEYERWLAQAFEADPHSADGHYVRSLALRGDGDEDGARRELEAALASDPEHRAAARALGK